ncbi:MAG: ATPase, partial [Pseudonocardia sp.]|nr:ATPase [Pseudonocardia sp.]
DAALHYLARMIVAGEDPRFIARRLIVHASEDVGLADPTALPAAVAAAQTVQLIGMPEARLALAQVTLHLATAPKSNAVITAIDQAIADVQDGAVGGVPPHLRDGHYAGAARLGNAVGYRYPHDAVDALIAQQYPPDELVGRDYYQPSDRGTERELAQRVPKLRRAVRGEQPPAGE